MGKDLQFDRFLCCSVMSEIFLFHGKNGITQDMISEKWNYDNCPPSPSYLQKIIRIKNIKWYINNFMKIEDDVWNNNFLLGLKKSGDVNWCHLTFPTFRWRTNKDLLDELKLSPFHGSLSSHSYENYTSYQWNNVPALYLSGNEEDISFVAGILFSGNLVEKGGWSYARYNKKTLPYLEKFGIPIEYSSPSSIHNLISPIWPALFSQMMPNKGSKWNNIKNAYKASKYASILWRIYISNDVPTGAMPYLESRRSIYKKYGMIEQAQKDWIQHGLSQLDNKIINVIRNMKNNV